MRRSRKRPVKQRMGQKEAKQVDGWRMRWEEGQERG